MYTSCVSLVVPIFRGIIIAPFIFLIVFYYLCFLMYKISNIYLQKFVMFLYEHDPVRIREWVSVWVNHRMGLSLSEWTYMYWNIYSIQQLCFVYQARPSSLLMSEKGLAKVTIELQLLQRANEGSHIYIDIYQQPTILFFQWMLATFEN